LLADGNFFVRTYREPLGMAREFWDDIPCQPSCEDRDWVLANADLVPLNGGDASGINFILAEPPGYAISGRVTDQAAGHGMSGVYIILFDATGEWFADTETNIDGDYSFAGLSATTTDDYILYVEGVPEGYTQELYDNFPCPGWNCDFIADSVKITVDGADQPGHDIALLYEGTRIFGTVTRTDSGAPVSSSIGYMRVDVYDTAGNWMGDQHTNEAGQYQVQVGPGDYHVLTEHDQAYHGLINENWDNHPCDSGCDPLDGDPVTVVADQTTIANFSLATGATISGTVFADSGHVLLQD
jgi:hypothetical protein